MEVSDNRQRNLEQIHTEIDAKMKIRYRLFKLFNRTYLLNFNMGIILLNFIVQRIFRINSKIPILVHFTSRIDNPQNLIYPSDCDAVKKSLFISGNCYFTCAHKVFIGRGTIFAPGVIIQTINHVPGKLNQYVGNEVRIGENCWLGAGCVILPGVTLGDNVVVGANAVVTKSVGSNVVIAGVPAKEIKKIEID